MEALRGPLKDFLMQHLYRNYRVVRMAHKAKRFIKELFGVYVNNPEQLPPEPFLRIKQGEDTKRVVCDYIAGMTDRYALDEYKKLFDPYEKV
jgi:dGTPase